MPVLGILLVADQVLVVGPVCATVIGDTGDEVRPIYEAVFTDLNTIKSVVSVVDELIQIGSNRPTCTEDFTAFIVAFRCVNANFCIVAKVCTKINRSISILVGILHIPLLVVYLIIVDDRRAREADTAILVGINARALLCSSIVINGTAGHVHTAAGVNCASVLGRCIAGQGCARINIDKYALRGFDCAAIYCAVSGKAAADIDDSPGVLRIDCAAVAVIRHAVLNRAASSNRNCAVRNIDRTAAGTAAALCVLKRSACSDDQHRHIGFLAFHIDKAPLAAGMIGFVTINDDVGKGQHCPIAGNGKELVIICILCACKRKAPRDRGRVILAGIFIARVPYLVGRSDDDVVGIVNICPIDRQSSGVKRDLIG